MMSMNLFVIIAVLLCLAKSAHSFTKHSISKHAYLKQQKQQQQLQRRMQQSTYISSTSSGSSRRSSIYNSNKQLTITKTAIKAAISMIAPINKAIKAPKIVTDTSSKVIAPMLSFLSNKWKVVLSVFFTGILGKLTTKRSGMESEWKKRGINGSFKRTIEVWVFSIKFLYLYAKVEKLKKGDPIVYSNAKSEIAIILRDKILELGPTFIKLGQLLSTRIDVLPKEYISALALLQDQVPGFSGDIATTIIESELGKPISELYETFNPVPLAAASLGQVHIGTLKGSGQKVAIKVQRQGLKELFDMDLKNIRILALILDAVDPKTDGASRNWVSIYDESARLLYKEIQYRDEALNSIRFQNNFKDTPWVKVPDVYQDLSTDRMLTMEYVPGIKINDIDAIERAGIDRSLVAKRSAESYLSQICRYGFFHCDPHPGNLAVDSVEGGRIIYYDFGMMDELKDNVKGGLVDLIFGVYENEPKEVCDALERIEVLKRGVDRVSIEKIVRYFLGEFKNVVKLKEAKWVSQLSKEEQKEIRRARRAQLGSDLFSIGNDIPFSFPPTFTFVFRAFISLDGIGKGLDKSYDLTRLAQPYLKELVDLRDGSATLSFLKSAGKKLGWRPIDIQNAITSPRKIAEVDDILRRMEQGDLKLRVRSLESEQSFKRLELVQNNLALAIAASGFLNVGIMLAGNATSMKTLSIAARISLFFSGIFGIQIPLGLFKLKKLDNQFASFKQT